MRCRRIVRTTTRSAAAWALVPLAAALALSGCTADSGEGGADGGDGGGGASAGRDPATERHGADEPGGDAGQDPPNNPDDGTDDGNGPGNGADPGDGPTDPGSARALARAVSPVPEDFGPGFRRQDPYETDPGTWALLDEECVWQRAPLPDGVLASLSRNVELPVEAPGAPPLQGMSSVTVFDSVEAADARMAGILQEALRCPDQELRTDEFVTDLISGAPEASAGTTQDTLYENGRFVPAAYPGAGPYAYCWTVARVGTVVTAVSVKGTEGHDETAVENLALNVSALMAVEAETRLNAPNVPDKRQR